MSTAFGTAVVLLFLCSPLLILAAKEASATAPPAEDGSATSKIPPTTAETEADSGSSWSWIGSSVFINFAICISLFFVSFVVTAIALIAGALIFKFSKVNRPTKPRDMKGKTVIVTGANSGEIPSEHLS
ncbi:Hypothetical protein NTJ_09316 [Nesidiocoris tenuis]|uniref:Uncharacterized protein n=1 Tax=Nesidiocoris tenuis TaxID=355587 RepID=A0ABN7AWD2_9HEMI|nr:Hypothetical protein NTJ_09316 [Nesidiocoris tenuis]